MSTKTALELALSTASQPSTPEHKRFRLLLERIQKARLRLQSWQEALPRFAQSHAAQVGPLQARLDASRREWAFELEQLVLAGRWSHAERAVLDRMILDLARSLLGKVGGRDAELKALFNRISPVDFDAEAARHLASMKSLLEKQTGVDLDDSQADTFDDLMQDAQQRMADRARAEEAAQESSAAARKPRKQTSAAARRAEADAVKASQSVRAVYRKLAALLHPDRAPAEATAEQRQLRHEQMSQANAAYAAGDLLTLLTLQLRWEQVDLAQAAQVTDLQVRHFNKVLAQQLQDIDDEIRERESAFCATYGYLPDRRPDPLKLPELLKDAVREVLAAEAMLVHDRRLLRSDAAGARRLLKQLAQEQRHADLLGQIL